MYLCYFEGLLLLLRGLISEPLQKLPSALADHELGRCFIGIFQNSSEIDSNKDIQGDINHTGIYGACYQIISLNLDNKAL